MGKWAALRVAAVDLACVRGGRDVLSGLSFRVDSGQTLALTGANGVGKTTLLRLLAGLLRASAGKLELAGGDPEASLAEQAHYLGHQDALKPALTVAENLDFWARYLGQAPSNAQNFDTGLEMWGLRHLRTMPAAYLSAGQRRRLSLCRLTAVQRPVWLLDEPTAALDAAAQETLGDLMRSHLAQGGIVIAATHGPLPVTADAELRLGKHREAA